MHFDTVDNRLCNVEALIGFEGLMDEMLRFVI